MASGVGLEPYIRPLGDGINDHKCRGQRLRGGWGPEVPGWEKRLQDKLSPFPSHLPPQSPRPMNPPPTFPACVYLQDLSHLTICIIP